ncbi:MAG: fibro-slime domain-containing protein [Lachnospiraceae bacterium]|nr:fibro-slime domain-containing protein [Lachnospiraceae bacterium]
MEYGFLSRAGKFLQEQTKRRRWMMIFLCLATGVTLGTLGFLKLYGQAMTHKVKMLDCQYEVHEHTEDCYEENEDGEEVLVCGMADYVIHVHNDDCYDQKGNLVCQLSEHELHEHDDSCWEEEEVLICGEEESEGSAAEVEEAGTADDAEQTAEPAEDSQEPEAEEKSGSDAETVKELACEKEEHKHDDSCYADGAGCDKEEHTHGDSCYEKTEELVCDAAEHTHDDSCYTAGESELTCEESEHEHGDDCYDEEGNLVCEESEHTHGDGCYSEGGSELTCEMEEHTHGDGCYEVTETLVCETEEHEHDDSCAAESELVCEIEEHEHDDSCYVETETEAEPEQKETSEPAEESKTEEDTKTEAPAESGEEAEEGHTHTDDCYETQEVLTCGELELHTHDADPESETCCYTEDCFDEEGNLIEGSRPSCGLLQLEEHIHTEECFKVAELTPEEIAALNGGATLHVHTDECYDEEGNLICGHEVTHLHQLECYDEDGNLICGFGGEEQPKHEHDAACYDEEGNLICGNEDAKDHEHDADCYDEEGNLICEYTGVKDHEHDANCYDEEGNLICGYEGVKDHEHDASCYDILGELICGYEGVKDHVHTEECYDEDGNLICGREVLEVYSQSKRFECDDYIVVARYNEDAEIPEEAELLVEQITPESDGEHYASRETEYRAMVEDEMASMRALLKIGFYMEGEDGQTEVEPKTPVAVAVQFLDEDGLAEGKPITVIHFAEEGTEKLDGSHAKDNSTTFKIDSFSEIAIGYGPEEEIKVNKNGTLHISNDFEFDADPFHMVFHVEGDAKSIDGSPVVVALPEEKKPEDESALPGTEEPGEGDALPEGDPADGEGELPEAEESVQPDADAAPEVDADTEGDAAANPEGDAATDGDAAGNENVSSSQLNFHVKSLDDDAELREALMSYLGESTDEVNRNILHTISYGMTYGDVELDLSNCVVTAEITLGTAAPIAEGGTPEGESFPEDGDVSEPETAGDEDVPEEADTEPTDDADEPETADEGLTEGTENTDAASDDLPIAGDGQENTEPVSVISKKTAVVNEITEDKKEVQAFKELLTDMDEETEISVMAIGVSPTGQMNKLATMAVGEEQQMDVSWNGGVMAIADESTSNPIFTVQYYAYAQIMATENPGGADVKAIRIIDTVQSGQDGVLNGAQLPKNQSMPDTRNMYVKKSSDGPYTIGPTGAWHVYDPVYISKDDIKSLTKIYTADLYEFKEASGGLSHINKFAKEGLHYGLWEVWVTDDKTKVDSVKKEDWTHVYKVQVTDDKIQADSEEKEDWTFVDEKTGETGKLTFLNDSTKEDEARAQGLIPITITKDTVIRLVGRSNDDENINYPARFYDYDITNGNPVEKNKEWDRVFTGINSLNNYQNKNKNDSTVVRYGFGNNNCGNTGLQNVYWPAGHANYSGNYTNYINRARTKTDGKSSLKSIIEKCSFGLTESSLSNGYPVIKADAPDLFNPQAKVEGRTEVAGRSLNFSRDGDTYTLTSVTGSGACANNLNQFQLSADAAYGTKDESIGFPGDPVFTNQFWPMDNAPTFGDTKNGHDPKFGTDAQYTSYGLNASDDKQEHNSFFGMTFDVEFNLTTDYVGPLNYYFFGDDDMWVFLEYPNGSTKLICDIGGVHQAAGEYVDLWNYIQKPEDNKTLESDKTQVTEKYKLKFFYTERGASGSTCWMQFTLPSVNAVPVIDYTGNVKSSLTLGKKVEGEPTNERFDFTIKFDGSADNIKLNTYPYEIRKTTDGTTEEPGELVESGDIRSGGTFKLGDGETIKVFNLPDGTTYKIEEKKYAGYIPGLTSSPEGTILKDQTVEGNIDWDRDDILGYINQEVEYNLPETGGPGPIWYMIAGAFFILLGTGLMYNKKFSERRV